uniref:Uncharacterized protein n=1 Tax=Chlorocebus sabaeus TaxID=60711 RepID=A0A0D9RDV0_CHLSB
SFKVWLLGYTTTLPKAWRIQKGLVLKVIPPIKHIAGGELGGHMSHELTCSSFKPIGFPLEHKAV